jgi:hypothetical protein
MSRIEFRGKSNLQRSRICLAYRSDEEKCPTIRERIEYYQIHSIRHQRSVISENMNLGEIVNRLNSGEKAVIQEKKRIVSTRMERTDLTVARHRPI